MIGMTEDERLALHLSLKALAEIMEEIGWSKRLADLTETEALALMEVAAGAFQDAMRGLKASAPEAPF